uniref:Uncharacterized protein n=1 Tax=Dulem virus 36 TaxID=3145754 RepID=A0AAU8B042_9CAUD
MEYGMNDTPMTTPEQNRGRMGRNNMNMSEQEQNRMQRSYGRTSSLTQMSTTQVEEAYASICKRMCEALEFHSQLIDCFAFLGLQGFKRMAECQYMKECKDKMKMRKRYVDLHHKILPVERVEMVSVIPQEWYRYTTKDIDDSVLPKYTRMILKIWIDWEEETKRCIEQVCNTFYNAGAHADTEYCGELLADVEKEIKKVSRLYESMNSAGYDVTAIHSVQPKYHDKYKRKYQENYTAKAMKQYPEPYRSDDYRRRRIGF